MTLHIVLVEDSIANQKIMQKHLSNLFDCQVKMALTTGQEALEYLLSTPDHYDLVILDGKLAASPQLPKNIINGPDIARVMLENDIKTPVVLWTNDSLMLGKFDEVYGKRLPEIEKPCRPNNIEAVLKPIISHILAEKAKN